MSSATIAAVQAASVLMDREATLAKAVELIAKAAAGGARIVVFPEVFIPSTPVWVYNQPIWDRDDAWHAMLVDQAVTVPGPVTDRLGAAAQDAGVYLVMGVNEREPHGATIYNTILYFGPDGSLLGKHRKLVPTGPERTVWGMGDGSTLPVIDTPCGRLGGLICWENYMPLARFYLYASGVDIWVAPTLDATDSWVTTMRHIALEGRCYVIGVNPCVHIDQIPADFPAGIECGALTTATTSGWKKVTASSSTQAALSWPARRGTRKPFSPPRSSCPRCTPLAGTSTRRDTTTGPTSSSSPSTPAHAQP
jgi:predicted amidohydrolase